MKIAINTLSENPFHPSGSINFFQYLIGKLTEIDNENDYFIFVSKSNNHLFTANVSPKCHLILSGKSNESRYLRILSEHLIIPYLLKKFKIDIFFTSSSGGAVPLLTPKSCKVVSAIYGTHHLLSAAHTGTLRTIFRRYMTYTAYRKAYRIIVNSLACKKDVLNSFNFDEKKIRLIYHGFDSTFFHDDELTKEEKQLFDRSNITRPYILFVSVIWAYKNAHTLVEAIGKLVQENKINHQLVFIGNFDLQSGTQSDLSYEDRLFAIADKYNIRDRMNFIGYIPNDKVRPFYKQADIYVQPSFHETFGKTSIEAMLCGCPVVGANTGSTPEIIGDAGLLFDPYSPEDLANKLEDVLTNSHLRMNLIEKGKERAKIFTIENEARQFIQVFNECHKNSGKQNP